MFGFFEKPCKHKNKRPMNMSLYEPLNIVGHPHLKGSVTKEVYYCIDCRVMFLPWDGESCKVHEKQEVKQ
jgi:hypothetical protein